MQKMTIRLANKSLFKEKHNRCSKRSCIRFLHFNSHNKWSNRNDFL